MKLPEHKAGLFLQHNEHRGYYMNAADWLSDQTIKPEWKDDDSRLRAIDLDSIWILQWYPETPIGFNKIAAPTLKELLTLAEDYK